MLLVATLSTGSLLVGGCQTKTETPTPTAETVAAPKVSPPEVVSRFFELLKNGKAEAANKLLTSRAAQELKGHSQTLSPEDFGSPKYAIGSYSEDDGIAMVDCEWTGIDDSTGENRTATIQFLLRKEEGEWRLFGYECKPFDDWEPVVFSFEDFASMNLRQRIILDEAIKRRRGQGDVVEQVAELPTDTQQQ
jgi:hypothetical protein